MTRSAWGVVLTLVVAAGGVRADDDPLVAAARRREAALANLRVELHFEELIRAGSLSALPSIDGKKAAGPVPPTDVTVNSDNVLLFSGNKVRVEHNHPDTSITDGVAPPRPKVHVSDGQRGLSSFPTGIGFAKPLPFGIICRGPQAEMIGLYLWYPIILHARGLTAAMTNTLVNDFRPAGGRRTVDGRECEEYQSKLSANSSISFLVDVGAGHVVRRVQNTSRGQVTRQFDIRFAEPAGDLPIGFTHTSYGPDGKIARVLTATVVTADRNVTPTDDQFRLVFPTGYRVEDLRDGKTYQVLDDGSMQVMYGRAGESSPTVAQPTTGWFGRNRRAVFLGAASVLVVLGLLSWRRHRGRTQP